MVSSSTQVQSVLRTSRVIFIAIFAQATVFAFWGLSFFLTQDPLQPPSIAVYVVFGFMAVISFAYGIRFFKNYTKVKRAYILSRTPKQKKETLLLAFAIQLLLLEFVCVLGIMLAVFVQKTAMIYPFYAAFVVGLYFSYPKADWYKSFYEEANA